MLDTTGDNFHVEGQFTPLIFSLENLINTCPLFHYFCLIRCLWGELIRLRLTSMRIWCHSLLTSSAKIAASCASQKRTCFVLFSLRFVSCLLGMRFFVLSALHFVVAATADVAVVVVVVFVIFSICWRKNTHHSPCIDRTKCDVHLTRGRKATIWWGLYLRAIASVDHVLIYNIYNELCLAAFL